MLSYFPQIRPEESTYSIFARLQFALQPSNNSIIGTMLFNRQYEVGRLNFQNSFDYLCSNLPSTFTPELFFYNNTIFPLYIPFLSVHKQEKALAYFKGVYPDKIQRHLNITCINNGKKYVRICKECVKEDFYKYGEPYYRRQHEIEINKICYKHKIPLYEYTVTTNSISRRYYDCYTVLSNSKEISIPEEFKEKLLNITNDINSIFTSNFNNWNINITKKKIASKLKVKGYLSSNGIKFQNDICLDFKRFYSEDFLDYINYNFDINISYNWVRIATTNYHDANPIQFILLIRFLFGNFENFYKYNGENNVTKDVNIFNIGPYPCLNSICPNYNKLVIKDIIKINKYTKYHVATFKCNHCGYTYTRRSSDKNNDDIYTKVHVKDYGHLWHKKLKECIENGIGYNEMCIILHYKGGVNKYKYKKNNLSKTPKIKFTNEPDILLIEQYKNEVIKLKKENPNANRKTAYTLNHKVYSYLLRTDKEWLSTTLGDYKHKKAAPKEERYSNYWLTKDNLLSNQLLIAINNIKSENELYNRITIRNLQKHIGYDNLTINKSKLPKCFEILDKVCETILDYRHRRVKYAIKKISNNKRKVTVKKVLRIANLDKIINPNYEIISYVEMMVSEYNNGNINIINTNDK